MTGEDERIEMEIRKRNGKSVPFQQEKIFNAMKKAFDGQGREIGGGELEEILAAVLNNLSVTVPLTVERVQDEVERTLMERGHYEVAKAYILYREKGNLRLLLLHRQGCSRYREPSSQEYRLQSSYHPRIHR